MSFSEKAKKSGGLFEGMGNDFTYRDVLYTVVCISATHRKVLDRRETFGNYPGRMVSKMMRWMNSFAWE